MEKKIESVGYDTYGDGTRKCFQNRDDMTEARGSNSTCHVERNVNAKEARPEQALHSIRRLFISTHAYLTAEASTKRRRFVPRWIPLLFDEIVTHTVEQMFGYLLDRFLFYLLTSNLIFLKSWFFYLFIYFLTQCTWLM